MRAKSRPLIWHMENVPESEPHVTTALHTARLCGSMAVGLRVFRHRVFYCNYPAVVDLPHIHDGKFVGSRGVRYSKENDTERYGHLPTPNMYGIYSQPQRGRGTLDEWHGAMGFDPGTFTRKGLVGALPLSYGRLLAPQMVAHFLHRSVGCPVTAPELRTRLENEVLNLWESIGYHTIGAVPSDKERRLPKKRREPLEHAPPLVLNEMDATMCDKPYEVSREQQLQDVRLRFIIERLESDTTSPALKATLLCTWQLRGGLLTRLSVDTNGECSERLVVPEQGRGPLLRRFHHLCHRGHEPLYNQLKASYYWKNMEVDCVTFTNACQVCAGVRSRALAKAPLVPVPTPARPFEVIHLDHKGPLPLSGKQKYAYILVIVCALTRFTLYIPTEDSTAETTLRMLMSRVFSVFGYPLIIVSDNGPAFRSELMAAMSKFFGYRHIPILPYNAQANGVAESSVKRIKLLLDRHCKGYKNWHQILPLAQLLLNTHKHSSTMVSPYMSLFGREPYGLEHLENPALLPDMENGSEWLNEVKCKMMRLHEDLKKVSDTIKEAIGSQSRTYAAATNWSRVQA